MRWLLPEGVEEVLPPRGWELEEMRRDMLDLMRERGFELILPPLIEHADALLSGVGGDLDLQTFRLTDQLSGRQLGLRADITPQAARVDARHLSAAGGQTRLCYLGTVVRTRPETSGGSRCLRQLGAEIFGQAGITADVEIIALMLALLERAGIGQVHLDLGHVAIYQALAARAGLAADDEATLIELLQKKAAPDLSGYLQGLGVDAVAARGLRALIDLHGDVDVLTRAGIELSGLDPTVDAALQALSELHAKLKAAYPDLAIHLDLAELRGWRYHTGVVFAAFVPTRGREVARGGRYDGVGQAFGADRPATGFSCDLNELINLAQSSGGA